MMSLAEILDNSIGILKRYFKSMVLFTLTYGILIFVCASTIITIASVIIAIAISSLGALGNIVPAVIISVLITILMISFALSSHIGVIKLSSQEFTKYELYVSDAMQISFVKLFKVIGVVALGLIAFIPIGAVIAGMFYLFPFSNYSSWYFTDFHSAKAILLLIVLLIEILVSTAIIFAFLTWFIFTFHSIVIEKTKTIQSIKRSFKLVKGSFWRLYISYIMIFLSVYAINFSLNSILAVIFGIISFIAKLFNFGVDYMATLNMLMIVGRLPLSILIWLTVSPLTSIMTTVLYYNQRYIDEGYDIELRLRYLQRNYERMQTNGTTK